MISPAHSVAAVLVPNPAQFVDLLPSNQQRQPEINSNSAEYFGAEMVLSTLGFSGLFCLLYRL
jgi:hypothetical protein